MSDLHLEMHRDRGHSFIDGLDPTGIDVLVLAGDVTIAGNYEMLSDVFNRFCRLFDSIVYVPGNHEFYHSSPAIVGRQLERLVAETYPKLTVLNNSYDVVKGQRFIGGPMWFPATPDTVTYQPWLNDYRLIKNYSPWVHEQNTAFKVFMEAWHRPGDVIVTHYLPAPESVGAPYQGSPLNCYFVSDMTDFIVRKEPRLWIHGHTHVQCDYQIGPTRVVANPLGYPHESEFVRAFQPRLILEVS